MRTQLPGKRKINLLVSVKLIHTFPIDTICVAAQVDFRFTPLSTEPVGTFAREVVDEVGTIASQ